MMVSKASHRKSRIRPPPKTPTRIFTIASGSSSPLPLLFPNKTPSSGSFPA
jgi:hypothetical protein